MYSTQTLKSFPYDLKFQSVISKFRLGMVIWEEKVISASIHIGGYKYQVMYEWLNHVWHLWGDNWQLLPPLIAEWCIDQGRKRQANDIGGLINRLDQVIPAGKSGS